MSQLSPSLFAGKHQLDFLTQLMKLSTFSNYSSGFLDGASEAQLVEGGTSVQTSYTLWFLKVLSKYSVAKKGEDEFNQEEDRF